jgi:hypothetical protein
MFLPARRFLTIPLPPGLFLARFLAAVILPPLLFFAIFYLLFILFISLHYFDNSLAYALRP